MRQRNSGINNNRICKTAFSLRFLSFIPFLLERWGENKKYKREKKKLGPCSKNTKKKRGKEKKGGSAGEHLFPLGTEVF